jgi:hypothetical protein
MTTHMMRKRFPHPPYSVHLLHSGGSHGSDSPVRAGTSGGRKGRKDVQQTRRTAAIATRHEIERTIVRGDADDPAFYRGLAFALGWTATAWALVAGVVWALTRWR